MGRINKQQMGPLFRSRRFQYTIHVNSLAFVSSDKSQSIFLLVTMRRDPGTSPEMGSGKGIRSGTPGYYSRLFLVPKKNGKLCPVIDLSLLNQYIRKQPFKMETVNSVRQWSQSVNQDGHHAHIW